MVISKLASVHVFSNLISAHAPYEYNNHHAVAYSYNTGALALYYTISVCGLTMHQDLCLSYDLTHIVECICDCLWENRPYWHNNWNPFYGLTLKLHSPTVQAHQAHGYR